MEHFVRDLSVENHHLRKELANLKHRLRLKEMRITQLEEELKKQHQKAMKLPVEL